MGDSEARSRSLEREMDILRALSTRTPRGHEASSFGFAVRAGESGRNDAVTGSGEDFNSPEANFRDLWQEQEDSRVPSAKFVSVGKLPLEQENPVERQDGSPDRCDGGNQYLTVGSRHFVEATDVGTLAGLQSRQLEGLAPWARQESAHGAGDVSVRRQSGIHNVTTRETKRPKEREKDKEYRRLTLSRADFPLPQTSLAGKVGGAGGDGFQLGSGPFSSPFSVPSPTRQELLDGSRFSPRGTNGGVSAEQGFPDRSDTDFRPYDRGFHAGGFPATREDAGRQDDNFWILLIHEGVTVRQHVTERMSVLQLTMGAAGHFGLEPDTVVLMLFSGAPVTLDRARTLAGPPRVLLGSTVFVFTMGSNAGGRSSHQVPGGEGNVRSTNTVNVGPQMMHSKLLGTFKLPKFDGTPRAWKQWDRDFVRFLGLHQLEHVLLEDFPSTLLRAAAVASNKVVYFLIEEAVLPGTLACKYVRQAALWDGHGAYMLLYDGYVFSGPQNATMLMAQLSNMRFQGGETGTAFCLRLIELFEELELLPGTAAVCLNDTAKLGYLLSAIRHEKDLGAVYVQLQTDQLRGKVTFEQACQELHFRCEAIRADNLLDTQFRPTKTTALLSTEIKHLDKEKVPCLVKDCAGMIVSFLPLCEGCFLQCKSGKIAVLELRDGLGSARYNTKTEKIEFPSGRSSQVAAARQPQTQGGERSDDQSCGSPRGVFSR
jgi:hypothetical protein